FIDTLCFFLPGAILVFTTKGHRRLGDMAAGTFVVSKQAVGTPPHVPGVTAPEWPAAGGYGAGYGAGAGAWGAGGYGAPGGYGPGAGAGYGTGGGYGGSEGWGGGAAPPGVGTGGP